MKISKYYNFLLFFIISLNMVFNHAHSMEEEKDLFRKGIINFNLKNHVEAKRCLKPLAKIRNYYAQYYLGQIYEFGGNGVEQSISKAKKLYVNSVINGCMEAVPAMMRIGEKEHKQKIKEEKIKSNSEFLIKKKNK